MIRKHSDVIEELVKYIIPELGPDIVESYFDKTAAYCQTTLVEAIEIYRGYIADGRDLNLYVYQPDEYTHRADAFSWRNQICRLSLKPN